MNEYTQLAVYLLTGSVGAIWHYAKKRYIEKTLTVSFTAYVTSDFSATFNTIVAIATAEFSLSALNVSIQPKYTGCADARRRINRERCASRCSAQLHQNGLRWMASS